MKSESVVQGTEKKPLCDECKTFMLALLDKRIRRILEIGREELSQDEREETDDIGQSQCFHLMEIQQILKAKKTCGVYDDYGAPPTIEGPLFRRDTGPR